eukprot:c14621_g1_i1 orf=2-154(-)
MVTDGFRADCHCRLPLSVRERAEAVVEGSNLHPPPHSTANLELERTRGIRL